MAEQKPQTLHEDGELGKKYLSDDVNRLRDGIVEDTREYDEGETRKIMRKIDYRLIPLLVVLYLFSFLDRGNSASCLVHPVHDCVLLLMQNVK